MKKLLAVFLLAIALVGCSSKPTEQTVTVCKTDEPFLVYESGEQSYTAEGDVVVGMKIRSMLNVGSKEGVEALIAQATPNLEEFNKTKGIKASFEVVDEVYLADMLEIDLVEGDLKEIVELGLFPGSDAAGADFISLKMSVEQMEADGFTCTVE